jgi:cell shape-determining protein MreC
MKYRTRLSKQRVLGILLIASCVLSLLGAGLSDRIRQAVQPALAPIGDGGMYIKTLLESQLTSHAAGALTGEEARALQERYRSAEDELRVVRGERDELLRRRQALDSLYGRLPSTFLCKLMPARVVGEESLPYGQSRALNAGTRRGATPGGLVTTRRLLTDRGKKLHTELAVMSQTAVVGRIVAAGPFTARMALVTDRGFVIRARIRRVLHRDNPREITVEAPSGMAVAPLTDANNRPIDVEARGDGVDALICGEDVQAYHNILPGDVLVTSGRDAFLPAEIRIGEVTGVARRSEHRGFVTLKIKPQADLATLRDVYIVYPLGGRLDADDGEGKR